MPGCDAASVPIACSLTAAGLKTQADRWQRLAAQALIERSETAEGVELRFRQQPGVADELSRLTAIEADCCWWAHWLVHADAGQVTLAVRSTGQGIPTLHRMFAGYSAPASSSDGDDGGRA